MKVAIIPLVCRDGFRFRDGKRVEIKGCNTRFNTEINTPAPCPSCGNADAFYDSSRKEITATTSTRDLCGDVCETATGTKCKCACGGMAHGIRS